MSFPFYFFTFHNKMFILTPAQINKSLLNQSKRILALAICQRLEITIKILLRVIKLFFFWKKKSSLRETLFLFLLETYILAFDEAWQPKGSTWDNMSTATDNIPTQKGTSVLCPTFYWGFLNSQLHSSQLLLRFFITLILRISACFTIKCVLYMRTVLII